MKIRYPLSVQILSFLLLHLTVLLVLFVMLFNAQFGIGWEPLVTSPIGERVEAIAWMINRQIQTRPVSSWDGALAEFGKFYGVKFYIFDGRGKQLAGPTIELPEPVMTRLKTHWQPKSESIDATNSQLQPPKLDFIMPPHSTLLRPHGRFLLHTKNPDAYWIGTRIRLFQPKEAPGTMLAVTNNLWQTRIIADTGLFFAALLSVFLLSLVIWWPFVYRLNRALKQLTLATEKIAEGKFDVPLEVGRTDEIGHLTESINSMALRLNRFVNGQKRFLGDIAHELCSPISRLQVELELLERTASSNQTSTIRDIREDVEEMSELINELLAFSKAGLTPKQANLAALNLYTVLRTVVSKTCPTRQVVMEVTPDLTVQADPLLLERALTNVLRNSVRYAETGDITIDAQLTSGEVVLTISDQGPGVPDEAIEQLGQPFYRPESSRTRTAGGVGLGLAIVKTCIESCGGTLKIRNRPTCGLSVEIRLSGEQAASVLQATSS